MAQSNLAGDFAHACKGVFINYGLGGAGKLRGGQKSFWTPLRGGPKFFHTPERGGQKFFAHYTVKKKFRASREFFILLYLLEYDFHKPLFWNSCQKFFAASRHQMMFSLQLHIYTVTFFNMLVGLELALHALC